MVYAEVSFTRERDDFREYFRQAFGVRRTLLRNTLTGALTALVSTCLIAYIVYQVGSQIVSQQNWPMILILVPILFTGFIPVYLLYSSRRRFAGSKSGPDVTIPMTVRLTDAGIEVSSRSSDSITPWNVIREIREDDWAVYFEPTGVGRFVPKRAFQSTDAAREFVLTARRLHGDYRPAAPVPVGAYGVSVTVQFAWDKNTVDLLLTSIRPGRSVEAPVRKFRSTMIWFNIVTTLCLVIFIAYVTGPTLLAMIRHPGVRPPGAMYYFLPVYGFMLLSIFAVPILARLKPGKPTFLFNSRAFAGGVFADMDPTMAVTLDRRGVVQRVHGSESVIAWEKVVAVKEGAAITPGLEAYSPTGLVQFISADEKPVAHVPRTAFGSEEELRYFVDVAKAYIESVRTGNPPVLPEAISWPPPPSG